MARRFRRGAYFQEKLVEPDLQYLFSISVTPRHGYPTLFWGEGDECVFHAPICHNMHTRSNLQFVLHPPQCVVTSDGPFLMSV